MWDESKREEETNSDAKSFSLSNKKERLDVSSAEGGFVLVK